MAPLPAVVRHMMRLLLIVLRSEPKLVWAFVFVRVVGPGPTAGVLAIALTYGGMRSKVYCGLIESGGRYETETSRCCCWWPRSTRSATGGGD